MEDHDVIAALMRLAADKLTASEPPFTGAGVYAANGIFGVEFECIRDGMRHSNRQTLGRYQACHPTHRSMVVEQAAEGLTERLKKLSQEVPDAQ